MTLADAAELFQCTTGLCQDAFGSNDGERMQGQWMLCETGILRMYTDSRRTATAHGVMRWRWRGVVQRKTGKNHTRRRSSAWTPERCGPPVMR